jgi:tetratricopeptide (TPR) repeat protein
MPSALDLTCTGIVLHQKGDKFGARLHYLAALREDPKCLPALQNLGQLANDANELDSALAFTHKILHQCPNDGAQWSNLGNLLMRAERYDEATMAMERAAALIPDVPATWHNYALLHLRKRNYESALECINRAWRMGVRGLTIQNDKAHVLLHLGRLNDALPLYEARWDRLNHLPPWDFHIPEWQGEDLTNKSLLVHAEQGFGDSIMWLRFAKSIKCGRLTIGVPRCMESLAVELGLNVLAIEDMDDETMKDFDFQSPMYSALRWLGVERSHITGDRYIRIFPERTSLDEKLRIGICWASGRRNSEHDWRGRYSDLGNWLELATVPGVELVSLQQGRDANDIAERRAEGLIDDTEINLAKDWLATAKIIADLDLIVTVDTAVAHLAGAMGKPTWMLSQYTNCWRWWDIENGTGRPWYNSMRILRQPTPGDWKTLLKTCVDNLRQRGVEVEESPEARREAA